MTDTKKNIAVEFFRKNLLLISALTLSIILMFVFKNNNVTSLLNEKTTFLSNFELIDFKPLFGGQPLTNEEVFHFLMHNQIPVNGKNDRVLKIQERSPSVYSYNIRTADYKEELGSYKNFLKYLQVTEAEKKAIDKVLHECGKELNENILKGNEDELAISPRLVSIRQKTLIKLFSYLSEIRPSLTDEIFPPGYLRRKHMTEMTAMRNKPEKFLILTPDTVVVAEVKNSNGNNKARNEISVTLNSREKGGVSLEVLTDNHKDSNNLGIEWYKILPTHSKIVFNESRVSAEEDSLQNYLKLATDMVKQIQITINSGSHTISLRHENGNSRFSITSEEGLHKLEKMLNSDFNFANFSNISDLEGIGSLIDSISRNYEKEDSAEWVAKMNELIKKWGKKNAPAKKNNKEK
ncbi:MAG: hypothetical protein GXO87_00650 [Chlorobi bacterium]|nr:hypothetical protein [Chlorobiota bacterium]